MKKIVLFILFITIPIILICQTEWTLLNSGTTQDLNSIDFFDENNGLIVGNNGLIIRTIDGGDTWDIITSGISNNLNGISFANADTAIVVGGGPTILRTIDGGISWEVITVAIYGNLISVDMDISGSGIAGGTDQTILRTDDAGATWSITQTGYMGGGWQSAQMLDESVGFVFGSNSIFQPFVGKTTNSGTSFSFYNFYFELGAVSHEGKLYDGYFFDEFNGITAGRRWDGYGCISSTSDLNNWTTQHFTTPFYGIDFSSETNGYVVGGEGTIMHTFEAGTNWEAEDSGVFSQLNSVLFVNEGLGFVAGDGGVILRKGEPAFPPPADLTATIIDYNSIIRLEWGAETRLFQRDLLGYNVYFEGTLVAYVTSGPFDFYGPFAAGDYYFEVTAVYEEGASEPATVTATVVLDPPINVTTQSIPPNIVINWDPPARGIDSYNVYRDGTLIEEGVTELEYIDPAVPTGTYVYNVSALYDGGWESELSEDDPVYHVDSDEIVEPTVTELIGNYPNPFNPETNIQFDIKENESGVLTIFNMKGQIVVSQSFNSGRHNYLWNAADCSSGIYFYKLQTESTAINKKMLLLK